MTVLDDVAALLRRRSPDRLCDDCITAELKLSVRQHANHKTRELAREPGFSRQKGECSDCASTKLVIARNANERKTTAS